MFSGRVGCCWVGESECSRKKLRVLKLRVGYFSLHFSEGNGPVNHCQLNCVRVKVHRVGRLESMCYGC